MQQHQQDRHSREAVLLHISRQFEDIAKRVSQGEPLKDTALVRFGITMKDMEGVAGFEKLVEACKVRHLTARLEEHFYSQQPVFTRIYKVVIDGWS